jgi:N-acetylmuramoyl-L-alanine amidase
MRSIYRYSKEVTNLFVQKKGLKSSLLLVLILPLMLSCARIETTELEPTSLKEKIIVLDPGHGGTAETDHFRVGPTGEREEWVNLRVALMLKDLLEDRGAEVLMTRTEDVPVGLKDRADLAVENRADLFLSIHHNATADSQVNFPIIYYHGLATENRASVELGKKLGRALRSALFEGKGPVSIVSDHVIFPNSGAAVIRHSYGIPGVIGEASFFSHAEEEARLKQEYYNRREALAYLQALEQYFAEPNLAIIEKYSTGDIPPFEVLQEAERMQPEALQWRENFQEGRRLFKKGDPDSLEEAYRLLTLSARAFPDSPVARRCHLLRAKILDKQGKTQQAEEERRRAREFYVPVGKR